MSWLSLYIILALVLLPAAFLLGNRETPFHPRSPSLARSRWPLLGSLDFFSRRWDWWREERERRRAQGGPSSAFSFWLAGWKVVAPDGVDGRAFFFGSPHLDFDGGYAALFGQGPRIEDLGPGKMEGDAADANPAHFSRRITALLKRERLMTTLPDLIADTKSRLDELGDSGTTDPFESIYGIVFQLTCRISACRDIAEDRQTLELVLKLFGDIEASATMSTILFPWFPGPAKIQRTISAGRLYMILKKIVDERQKTGSTEQDPLQFLIDEGDSMVQIIEFLIGSLFAGLTNSGINAAYILLHLGLLPKWKSLILAEIRSACALHVPPAHASLPLHQQLDYLPFDAWESSFPLLDLCLKDSIRLHLQGAALRRNLMGRDVSFSSGGSGGGGGEKVEQVVPDGALVAYHLDEIHQDPEVYAEPTKFDPERYLPDRAEDKKVPFGWLGWGAGRHPCLGMRFAKLEQNIIGAYFLARFDYEVVDAKGAPIAELPPLDRNVHSTGKPPVRSYLRYWKRED